MKNITNTILLLVLLRNLVVGQSISPLEISQFNKLGDCQFIAQYKLEVVYNLNKPEKKGKDILILEIGKNISKAYSYGIYKYDSIATIEISKGAEAIPSFQGVTLSHIIYKENEKMTVNHRLILTADIVYSYIEEHINYNWQITSESKLIFGYNCQKATCTFRGRNWEAWFTREIPISEGPWKFNGLPGLILKLQDQDKHFNIEIISFNTSNKPITRWEWELEYSSRKQVLSLEKHIHISPYNYTKSKGIQFNLYKKTEAEAQKFSFPYNPIELE